MVVVGFSDIATKGWGALSTFDNMNWRGGGGGHTVENFRLKIWPAEFLGV